MWTCRSSWQADDDDDDDGDGDGDDDDDDDDDVMMMMMMMMMMMTTLMKLVNSATKFRHGMDKFYQPNSGLRGSKSRDEAMYTWHVYLHRHMEIRHLSTTLGRANVRVAANVFNQLL